MNVFFKFIFEFINFINSGFLEVEIFGFMGEVLCVVDEFFCVW